ncbi:MAG: hypothetical protein ABEJ83_02705 [Candidatus Nanohaloarchaea archaeon]
MVSRDPAWYYYPGSILISLLILSGLGPFSGLRYSGNLFFGLQFLALGVTVLFVFTYTMWRELRHSAVLTLLSASTIVATLAVYSLVSKGPIVLSNLVVLVAYLGTGLRPHQDFSIVKLKSKPSRGDILRLKYGIFSEAAVAAAMLIVIINFIPEGARGSATVIYLAYMYELLFVNKFSEVYLDNIAETE